MRNWLIERDEDGTPRRMVLSGNFVPPFYESKSVKPCGPGDVLAYSKPANRWQKINWKYVRDFPHIYTRWKTT